MADDFPNQERVDWMRRMVEEAIGRGAALAGALPEGSAQRMNQPSPGHENAAAHPRETGARLSPQPPGDRCCTPKNWRLTIEERTIEPFGVPGLIVTARGVPGAARIVAYGAEPGGRRVYDAVPLTGDPRDAGATSC